MKEVWCRHRLLLNGKLEWKPPESGKICEECLPYGLKCAICSGKENLVMSKENPLLFYCKKCIMKGQKHKEEGTIL